MKQTDPQALREVWAWKAQAAQEVEDLPTDEAVRKRLEDALQTTRTLGIPLSNVLNMARLPQASNQ
jgi:hypothetical protein